MWPRLTVSLAPSTDDSFGPARRPGHGGKAGLHHHPLGSYSSITVVGVCAVAPDAVIDVTGSIYVAGGAVLDAQSAPSTITVGHGVVCAGLVPGVSGGFGPGAVNVVGRHALGQCSSLV